MFPDIPKYIAYCQRTGNIDIHDLYTKELKYKIKLKYNIKIIFSGVDDIISFSDNLLVFSTYNTIHFYNWRKNEYIDEK